MFDQGMEIAEPKCEGTCVEAGIGEEYKQWNYWDPVLIEAPTGYGKNTFVVGKLADYARESGQFVLLISNRVALSQQQKQNLYKKFGGNDSLPIARDDLACVHQFSNILLYSYQEVMSHLNDLPQSIGYVVFDEAHFFLSDGRFNSRTYRIFATLANFSKWKTRIYMTATPQQVLPIILKEEQKLFIEKKTAPVKDLSALMNKGARLLRYRFPSTFQGKSLQFFKTWDVLVDYIACSPESEKWLIFVESLEEKKEIGELLKKRGLSAEYVDAANRRESKSYAEITRREKFGAHMLVSTIVLDNGINLLDPALKHIVIHSCDPVSTVQMAGRKRNSSEAHFYIKNVDQNEIQQFTRGINQLQGIIKEFRKDPGQFFFQHWGSLTEKEQKLFVWDLNSAVSLNQFADEKLRIDKGVLEELSDRIEDDPDCGFQKQVLSWFHHPGPFNATTMQLEEMPSYKEQCLKSLTRLISSYLEEGRALTLDDCFSFQDNLAETYRKIKGSKMAQSKRGTDGSKRIAAKVRDGLSALGLPYELRKKKKSECTTGGDWWEFIRT